MTSFSIRAAALPPTDSDRRFFEHAMTGLQEFERPIEPNRRPGVTMARDHVSALIDWASQGGGALIAETAGDPVGFLIFGIDEEFGQFVLPENQRFGRISDLWVDETARGRGIARALIAEAERRLTTMGIARVEIGAVFANRRAIALYEAIGYQPSSLILAKSLRP